MNSRNLNFIRPYNKRRAKKIADNKLLTKKILKKNGIKVPRLIAKIIRVSDLKNFDWGQLPKSFVLKPNRGLGGEGIVVVYGKKKNGTWVKADKEEVSIDDLKNHIANIIEGNFSLSGIIDTAFFEERVKILKSFKIYSYRGVPDVRIIVFNNTPVMAMLRLPTEQSGGRANLHLGGICVGIDLATGVTTTAITRNPATQQEYLIDSVPGTRHSLSGITIPCWNEILEIAVTAQQITNLGYLGIDIMIDRDRGPVVAELNSRPGLGIQIANMSPLKSRLEKIEGLRIKTVKRGVRVGQNLFGGEIEEDVEDMTGKKILGIFEKVTIKAPASGIKKTVTAKIDTGAYSSSICCQLAEKIGLEKIVKLFSPKNLQAIREKNNLEPRDSLIKYIPRHPLVESVVSVISANGRTLRPKVKVELTLGELTFSILATIANREELKHQAIVGRKDLRRFIIDPKKIEGK